MLAYLYTIMHFAIILHGLNGSGKSTIARLLHENLNFKIVSFDTYWRTHNLRPDLATAGQRDTIYNKALKTALREIKNQSVIIDCTSRSKQFRTKAVNLFQINNCGVIFIVCHATTVTTKARVLKRAVSDPQHINTTSELYEAMSRTFEPITEEENYSQIHLDTNQSKPKLVSLKTKNSIEHKFCTVLVNSLIK